MKLTGDNQAATCPSPALRQAGNQHGHPQFTGGIPLTGGFHLMDQRNRAQRERWLAKRHTFLKWEERDSRALSPMQTPLPFPRPSALPGKGTSLGSSHRNDQPLPCTHSASLPSVINLAVGETGEMSPWARTWGPVWGDWPESCLLIMPDMRVSGQRLRRESEESAHLRGGKNANKNGHVGLPWWYKGWQPACQCRGQGFDPWSSWIPHAL